MILLSNAHHCGFNCLSNFISSLLFLSMYFLSPQHLSMAPKGNLKWKTILRIKQPSFISVRAAVVTCKGRSMSVMLMDEIPSQMEVTSKKRIIGPYVVLQLLFLHLQSLTYKFALPAFGLTVSGNARVYRL